MIYFDLYFVYMAYGWALLRSLRVTGWTLQTMPCQLWLGLGHRIFNIEHATDSESETYSTRLNCLLSTVYSLELSLSLSLKSHSLKSQVLF